MKRLYGQVAVQIIALGLLCGCSYKQAALEPYEQIPPTCEGIRSEMHSIADDLGTTWNIRDAKGVLQAGLNVAVALSWISPEFAAANIILQGIQVDDQAKVTRMDFLGHAYDNQDCWDAGPIIDPEEEEEDEEK